MRVISAKVRATAGAFVEDASGEKMCICAALALIAAFHIGAGAAPGLGVGAPLNGKQVLPKDDPWNQDISSEPVDPSSAAIIARIGGHRHLHPDFGTVHNGEPNGIPYVIVSGDTKKQLVSFVDYGNESDRGPYPIPPDAPVEGGAGSDGDRHLLVIDRDNWMLYELWHARLVDIPTVGGELERR